MGKPAAMHMMTVGLTSGHCLDSTTPSVPALLRCKQSSMAASEAPSRGADSSGKSFAGL